MEEVLQKVLCKICSAAAMTDSKVMPKEERRILIEKLNEIDPNANYPSSLEGEQIDAHDTRALLG